MKNTSSFYSNSELELLGLRSIGRNVLISRFVRFYNLECISIGNNVRIDDFCILSGNITIKSNIHISAYSALYGAEGIIMDDYSGISPRTTIFSATDDFSGNYMVGPLVDIKYRKLLKGPVIISKYVQIGAGCVVLPDITIGEGTAIGSLSFINKSLPGWGIYAGVPAKYIKERNKQILELQKGLLESASNGF